MKRTLAVGEEITDAAASVGPLFRCHRLDRDLNATLETSERATTLSADIEFVLRFKKKRGEKTPVDAVELATMSQHTADETNALLADAKALRGSMNTKK